ncbi:MAG: hypothetical protein DMF61_06270 [Blastocatellia bacterium AA13]|nr:MAG: hypothetical protein DMF61_06270 [Blastocatellia bacterium AA13]
MEKRAAKGIGPQDFQRVHFFLPEELISFIDDLDAGDLESEQTVKDYKVKTKRKVVSQDERQRRKNAIGKTILDSMKRRNGKE